MVDEFECPEIPEMPAQLYPAPEGILPSPRFAVFVDGVASFTYLTTGPQEAEFTPGHTVSWTSFDLSGPVEVRIRRNDLPIHSVVVRPLSAGISTRIDDGVVVLTLDQPRKLSIECDGDLTNVCFLFANEPETEAPCAGDEGVVYFGPGVHEIGEFYPLLADTTYYLAPGSFLKGSFAGGGDGGASPKVAKKLDYNSG